MSTRTDRRTVLGNPPGLLGALKRQIRLFMRDYFARPGRMVTFPAWVLEGHTRAGNRLKVIYAGNDAERVYFGRCLFGKTPTELSLGRLYLWNVRRTARRYDADIYLFRTHEFIQRLGIFRKAVFTPAWLESKAEFDRDDVTCGKTRSRRRVLTSMARSAYRYEIAREQATFDDFYQNMYLPLMEKSHGAGALLMKYAHMMERVENGTAELLIIRQRDVAVAGSFIVYDKSGPRLFSEGVLNGDKQLLRKEIGSAIYLFSFTHLLERGFASADIGRCRAMLRDGVLYFKRRMGMQICGYIPQGLMLGCQCDSTAAREFFLENPLVVLEQGECIGVEFDAAIQGVVPDPNNELVIPGLQRMERRGLDTLL